MSSPEAQIYRGARDRLQHHRKLPKPHQNWRGVDSYHDTEIFAKFFGMSPSDLAIWVIW